MKFFLVFLLSLLTSHAALIGTSGSLSPGMYRARMHWVVTSNGTWDDGGPQWAYFIVSSTDSWSAGKSGSHNYKHNNTNYYGTVNYEFSIEGTGAAYTVTGSYTVSDSYYGASSGSGVQVDAQILSTSDRVSWTNDTGNWVFSGGEWHAPGETITGPPGDFTFNIWQPDQQINSREEAESLPGETMGQQHTIGYGDNGQTGVTGSTPTGGSGNGPGEDPDDPGEGGVDMSGVTSRLDTTNLKLTGIDQKIATIKTDTQTIANTLRGGEGFNATSAANSAKSSGQSAVSSLGFGSAPTGTPTVGGSGGLPSGVELQVGASTVTFGFSLPTQFSAADAIMRAGRSVILAALCIGLIAGCSSVINRYAIGLTAVQPVGSATGPENLLPGVAQTKSVVSAGLVVGIIAGAAAALVAVIDTWAGLGGVSIAGMFGAINLGVIGSAYAFLDQYFPVAASVQIMLMQAAVVVFTGPIYLAAATILKFIHV